MGDINILSNDLINKIAAGEVIERPASIVKELIENSIDAGASEIIVEIENGGISLIRVSDNGKGIKEDDIEKAFMRHATSKIKDEHDLFKITSLGFRGEALASIAAVSKVELITKTNISDFGIKAYLENGKIVLKEYCGSTDGTTITIKDIFYNVPARLKFLKSPSREQANITEIMQNLALSHPQISFKYIANKKNVFITTGDGSLKNVIYIIWGKNVFDNLIEVNSTKETITLKGFIGNSKLEKSNRNYQSIFVNGRHVRNKTITAAVENAYKSMLSINKFPLFVLNIFINPELIDVNVHPTKAEIKFSDEQKIFKEVYSCIKESLLKKDFIPSYKIEDNILNSKFQFSLDNNYKNSLNEKNSIFRENIDNNYNVQTSFNIEKIDKFKKINFDIDELDSSKEESNIDEKQSVISTNIKTDTKIDVDNNHQHSIKTNTSFPLLTVVGQLHFTYIIAEASEGFYLIDQHAAHERILFEKYLNEYNCGNLNKQILLSPIILEFSPSDKEKIFDNTSLLNRLGFDFEDFGGTTISLRTVPNNIKIKNYKQLIEEILLNINNGIELNTNAIEKIIYTMACKNAIKAGDKLNYQEILNLIKELSKCQNPFTCPHGRPTMIKFEYIDLEKKFKRIM
ncbi:DNA mismatch repair endonuclease MutL [Caloramator sp. ALD01]|uniref:DNA mismatch repair endonuclease MutL n=1 Tax=Caloramator sp. ALD01 TaxID=1031288 RepID=UPI0004259D69|nr:DNA mismatch repair endonuclease MutL [Caloramator sp. ALD01]